MMDDDKMADVALEAMFQEARRTPAEVPARLMARVLADAEAVQPMAPRGEWRRWLGGLGGLQGLGGLITACCMGFWLGVAPPQGLPDLAGAMFGVQADQVDALDEDFDGGVLTAFGWDIEEG
ncbi:hypothetical protein OS190_14800 [Sulfitobacter sp. F26204]|uniref:hypothetical protein n=1 Tax=Sulfitobacter sp. F26204 TaxID=2996014 RepID=UPI00225E173A|nr:hypothetical protein [Sulfitobacter sp. F26204]MCX7560843.1 hypothetical protein [Sulfitobacter sp. F26204]